MTEEQTSKMIQEIMRLRQERAEQPKITLESYIEELARLAYEKQKEQEKWITKAK